MMRSLTITAVIAFCLPIHLSEAQEATKVPGNIQAEMAYLVGQWDYTAIENGKKFEGRYTARWAPGRQALWLTFESEIHNDFGVSAWDPENGELVENWYGPTEGRLVLRYRIESDSKWVGSAKNIRPDGTVSKGTIEVQKLDGNNFRFVKDAEGQDMDITMRRSIQKVDSNLAGLEDFVGHWVAETKDGRTHTWTFAWDDTGNYLNNQMTRYRSNGEVALTMKAFVGWDKKNEQLMNWGRLGNGFPLQFYWTKQEDGSWQSKDQSGKRTWIFTHKDGKLHSTETVSDTSSTIIYSRK